MSRRLLPALLGLAVAALGLARFAEPRRNDGEEVTAAPAERPRLAVLLVIDQLRGDYLTRWDKLFDEGGFRRMEQEGAWFQNCHYPYAATITAVGHATVATGCTPPTHGVVGNDWYDRAGKKAVYCVASDRHTLVPPGPKGKDDKPAPGVSPDRLLAPTLADALKAATGGKGRVVALSLKDRSAVLPAGRKPDACYWADKEGQFVTSTYYRDGLHPWVRRFNARGPALRWFGRTWERLRPDLDYARWSGPDDVKGEAYAGFRRTFPHRLPGVPSAPKTYANAVVTSPFGNELLLELAQEGVRAEGLGRRATPDLLCVSLSSNDVVGHSWGPDSQEVLDVTLRTDRLLRDFLAFLDKEVGKGKYVVALTSDHGVCPLPEVSRSKGLAAQRVETGPLWAAAEAHLNKTFPPKGEAGKAKWVEKAVGANVYLDRALLKRRGVKPADAEKALARFLAGQEGVQAAYTRTQLAAGVGAGDALGRKVQASFHPDRSGDVVVVVKPLHLFGSSKAGTGTGHGSPHPYDTHVPLLVFGPGVRPGARRDLVSPEAAAVLLARALGVPPPAHARVAVPENLFLDAGG